MAERAAARAFLAAGEALLAVWDSTGTSGWVAARPQCLAEAGLALGLHARTVEGRLGVALGLRTHRLLTELLHDGGLGVAHALVALEEVLVVQDEGVAGRVLHEALASGGPDGAPGWSGTPSELRVVLRRVVTRLDPAAAARRAEQAAARTGVRLRDLADGLCDWTATGPAGQLVAADRLLDVLSRPDGPDDARSRGQRQVDALLGALCARAGAAVAVELQLELPVRTGVAAVVAPDGPASALPEPVVVRADLSPELLALLTGTPPPPPPPPPSPSPPPSPGPAEPGELRQTLEQAPQPPDGDSGRDGQGDVGERDEPGQQGEQGQQDGRGGGSAGLSVPPERRPRASRRRHRPRGGVTEIIGAGPVDAGWLAELLTNRTGLPVGLVGVRIRRLLVDRTGQVVGADASAAPLADLLAQATSSTAGNDTATGIGTDIGSSTTSEGATGSDSATARLLRVLFADLPAPPARTDAYRPTADQHRTVPARDTTCCFPGCRRRSTRSELDHRTAHPRGPTSTANLHPLCKHHHRLKHDGWHPHRHPDGTTTWTSPRGQTHTTSQP